MTKTRNYKAGDWLKRTAGSSLSSPAGVHREGYVGQVRAIIGNEIRFEDGHIGLYSEHYYKPTPNPTEEAVRLLEAAGWTRSTDGTLSPPKPKLTGKITVWGKEGCSPIVRTDDTTYNLSGYQIIAMTNWTEGDGLNTPDPTAISYL